MYRIAVLMSWVLISGVSVVPVQATTPFTCVTYGSELGAKWLYPTGLNNQGQVVGTYSTASYPSAGNLQSFLREADGRMNRIDYPGAKFTYAYTINNLGQVAGTYTDRNSVNHGFVRNADASFETFDAPLRLDNRQFDAGHFWVFGINDVGELSGTMLTRYSSQRGKLFHFIRDTNGQYELFDGQDFNLTDVGLNYFPFTGGPISNSREVLENFNLGGIIGSSILHQANGSAVSLSYPWYESGYPAPTQIDGSNAAGIQAGFTAASSYVGFIHTLDGHWPTITCPGQQYIANAWGVQPYAINDKGIVSGATGVGSDPSSTLVGFLAVPTGRESRLSLSHTSWTFSSHNLGETSGDGRIYLTSEGKADLHIQAIELGGLKTLDDSSDYQIIEDTCLTSVRAGSYLPATLPPGKTCSFTFHFTPGDGGPRPAQIVIFDDAPDAPHVVPINGMGNGPGLQLSTSTWTFSSHVVGETSGPGVIYARNPGTQPLQISSVDLTGYTPEDFRITRNTCPAVLAPSGNCRVDFVFSPVEIGEADAEIQFSTNDQNASGLVVLFGSGVAPKSKR